MREDIFWNSFTFPVVNSIVMEASSEVDLQETGFVNVIQVSEETPGVLRLIYEPEWNLSGNSFPSLLPSYPIMV